MEGQGEEQRSPLAASHTNPRPRSPRAFQFQEHVMTHSIPPKTPAAQKLKITKAQWEQLYKNGLTQSKVKGTSKELDPFPVIKLFYPAGSGTWLLTEIQPDDLDIAWGLCDLGMGCAEFGTVSLREMADFVGRAGLGIERDKFFEGTAPISRYIDAAREAGCIVENIPVANATKADAAAAE
jgi:hypothetical protein